ncbi:ankyrin repeat domain-containing protein [Pseudobacteroides cellulosolvens]|uniref:Ankyrin repeat-containing domain-containing protein n=3 Tax=Pseudobacteroides cellulosolvens TaxID=35825 RepID=A0A0L6JP25_9FIRM|nr:ankyrin repeat domain-containing protein [Pseudobacteroides cellulosolvens]KNY27455.1 Ankyrin repeat-containing domain-containing protein [Pseudobacteroides cellulosolvens ATCC 35603 = DSM 2933]
MFEELLDSSFWPDYADSAMIYASAHGDIDLIDKTVKKAGNSYLNNGLISIYKYSSLNEYKKVFNRKSLEYLFKKGAEPKSKKALRLLNDAVDAGNYDIVKFLIDKGVPVDKNILGSHYTGNRKIAELLIKKGADVNPAWIEGDSFELPLIRAISMLDPDMVDFWIKNGAKTDTEEYPHEVFIEKCRETSSRNYEWFDFINKDKCRRIEEIIRNALEITSYSQGQNPDDLTGFWTMRNVCFS